MKTHRILGILWAIYCGHCCFYFLRAMWSFQPPAAGHWDAWGILAVLFLLDLVGIVASISLFRGLRWPRWFLGLIAVYTVFGDCSYIIMTRTFHAGNVASSVFALVSLGLLFLPKHEPAE
jgi:hypothetical protein